MIMGSICTACFLINHGDLWVQSPDDSPRLCSVHNHLKNDADWDRCFGVDWNNKDQEKEK